MSKRYFCIFSSILILGSCTSRELDVVIPHPGDSPASIDASCKGYWIQGGQPVTKALVNNKTTVSLDANFLRIDEETQENSVNYEFDYDEAAYAGTTNWEKSYIIEGTVISSPDREGRRSIYLNPVQAYKLTSDGSDDDNTIYHHSRMVGWYPKTCELIKDDADKAAITMFNAFKNSMGADKIYKAESGKVFIKFEDLNGEKDIMVSDMIEAQQYHKDTEDGLIPCETSLSPGPHRDPFGYNENAPAYDNTFEYKHYLSAVRVFGYSEENTAQVISMWGHINKIVVADQPSTCYVALPQTLDGGTNRSAHSDEVEFEGTCNFDIVKTEIFGGDPNSTDPDDHLQAPDNPTLEGHDKDNMLYLGYALIAPGYDLKLDVHTDSGIYRVVVDKANFESGTIHTLQLKFETTGSIAAIVLDDASGVYYDLTTGETFDVAGVNHVAYKYANCYVIHSGIKYDSDGDNLDDKLYDGFCFSATKVGNGMQYTGYHPQSVDIEPVRAGLIWEEIEGTITEVSLMYGYVRFKCSAYDSSSRPCNAVVGVFDKYGTVLWSWHIWITNKAPELVDFNLGSATISVMNRNLGSSTYAPDTDANWSTDAEAAVLGTYGTYYQWGRKDPSMMPPSSDYRPMSTETSIYYDAYAFENNSWDLLMLSQPTVQDAIENPSSLILPSSIAVGYKYDWLYNSANNLWSYGSDGLKTIYDPCPYGYKVPGSEIESLFSASTYIDTITEDGASISNGDQHIRTYLLSSSNLGKTVGIYVNQGTNNVFFPFSGYKGVDRGMSSLSCAWKYVGEKGDYMSSSVASSGHRSRVYLSSATSWTETGTDGGNASYSAANLYVLDETNRRTAGSIRCVKDEAFASISIEMTLDKDSYNVGDNAYLSYSVQAVGVKDDLLNNLEFSIEYEYIDHTGARISDEASTDGNYAPSGTISLSSDKTGTSIITIREFASGPNYLKVKFIVKNEGTTRMSKTMLIPLSNSSWDSYQRYEATGNDGSGDIQTTMGVDTSNPFIFTFKNSVNRFLCVNGSGSSMSVGVEENADPTSDFLKSCFFYLEDLDTGATKSPYANVASCYFKVIDTGSGISYYLKRTEYLWGYGVSLTSYKSAATLIYISSDWSSSTQDYVDLIDADGNYLYYNSGQKRLQFDGSFASNLYQWYIHKGIL
ncbi:MAG: hypothetical protein ACI3ZL_01425 [Candidatus Cryptobacteroides sp.]